MKVLGVSHLVVVPNTIGQAQGALSEFGYQEHSMCRQGQNPDAKRPFIKGKLSAGFDACLMTSTLPFPPIELLMEKSSLAKNQLGAPAFKATFSGGPVPDTIDFSHTTSITQGIDVIAKGTVGKQPTHMAVTAMVRDELASINFWKQLNLRTELSDQGNAKVLIQGGLAGASMEIRFKRIIQQDQTWLNQSGLVCVSLLCTNAEKLKKKISEMGYAAGECFSTSPFGRAIRVFFTRGPNGEIYEFLSPER